MTVPKRPLLAALAFALPLVLAHPASAADLVVGVVGGQTGPFADAFRDYLAGARTFLDHANRSGGVNGRRIEVRVRDDRGEPAATVALTRELIEVDRADVLFGYFGDATVAAAASSGAFQGSGIALVGAVSGLDPGEGARNLFFTRASYEGEIRRAIEQFRGMGIRRFGIAVAALDSPRSVAARAVTLMAAEMVEHAATVEIAVDGQGNEAAAARLRAAAPQVVLVVGDTLTTAGFIKAWRRADAGTFLVGLSLVNHTTVMEMLGPELAAGTLITQVVPDPTKSAHAVVGEHLRLMKVYRDEPPSHLTLEGFLAAKTLVTALRRARPGAGRKDIAAALRAMDQADLGGITVNFAGTSRGYGFVDIAFLRRNGTLLH